MRTIYLHIGTHKTGTTALQRWLAEHRKVLEERNSTIYQGLYFPVNHMELYLASMRYERDSFGKQAFPNVRFDERYTQVVARRVRDFVSGHPDSDLIFSCEGLSLLRHDDELSRLVHIIGGCASEVKVVVCLRDRRDYLNAYRSQLGRVPGRQPASDYWSALYVEDDTWLTDYEGLIGCYSAAFGSSNVKVIDYDAEMQRHGNVIPACLAALGVAWEEWRSNDFDAYRDNPTSP